MDAAAPSRTGSASDTQRQLAAALLAQVDALRASGARVCLLAATSQREAVDPALRRAGRLDAELAFGALGAAEREEVLRCACAGMPLDAGANLASLAARLHGHTAADCAAVCAEAALCAAAECCARLAAETPSALEAAERAAAAGEAHPVLAGAVVRAEHLEAAAAALGPASLRGLAPEVPDVDWDDVGGLQSVKVELAELLQLPLRHGPLLARMGLRPPAGALLYGPPGCGKTLLAKAVAARAGANFLSVRGPELLQKWLGESERVVRELFAAARGAAPCVIFFDEMDALAPRRGGAAGAGVAAGDAAAARVLNQLLVEMDGLCGGAGAELVFVLGATNRPEALDPALLRPGRLDRLLLVPLPDAAGRRGVLAAALRRAPLARDVDLDTLAAATEGMSGADLAELVRRAGMAAIRELVAAEESAAAAGAAEGAGAAAPPPPALLTSAHLAGSLCDLRPSVSPAEAAHYAAVAAALQQGSLPAEACAPSRGLTRQQHGLVRALVQRTVGQTDARAKALQERVALLEGMLRDAGLAVPPAPTTEDNTADDGEPTEG